MKHKLIQGDAKGKTVTLRKDYLKHLDNLVRDKREIYRFLKFCLVGLSGIFVNMSLLWFLTEVAGLYYLISSAFAIEISILSNFVLNDQWTFLGIKTQNHVLLRVLKFNTVYIAGLAINITILLVLTELIGVYYLISNLFGICSATLFNFFFAKKWVWGEF